MVQRSSSNGRVDRWRLAVPIAALLLAPAAAWWLHGARSFNGEALAARAAPPLFDQTAGHVSLLAFGYTSCPDVCPTALSKMRGLLNTLGPDANRVQAGFVSVDPARDDEEKLREYVAAFDPRIVPFRFDGPKLRELLSGYGVVAEIRQAKHGGVSPSGEPAPYVVDHSSGFFVVDTRGELRLRLPPSLSTEQMAEDVRLLLSEAKPSPRVKHASVRVSSGGVAAAYLDVVNDGDQDERLLRVECPAAKSAELHEVVDDGQLTRMVAREEGFVVPANGTLSLAPGGKHVMLTGLTGEAGGDVELRLVFEHSFALTVHAPAHDAVAEETR